MIGRRLGHIVVGMLTGTKIRVQVEWISTYLNFIANDISRLNKESSEADFDYRKLKKKLPYPWSLSTIPVIKYPFYNDLGRSAVQKIVQIH